MERNNNCIRSSYNSTNLGGSSSSSGTTNIMRELNQQYHRYNHITTTGATTNIHNKVISSISSSSWDLSMLEKYEEDQYLHELSSWPPRSYTCSFCKREFRSAQALGGHMNVHRRDRARLRSVQSPTTTSPTTSTNTTAFNLNLNNNPNPADIISNTDCIRSSFSSSLPPPLQTAAAAAAAALSPRPPASSLASTKQHDHQASPCCRKLPFLDVSSTHYCRPSSYYPQPLSTYRDIPVHQCQQQQQQRGTCNDSVLLDGTLMSRKREQGYGSKMKSCPRSACLGIVGDKCDGALSKKPSLVRLDLEMGVLIDAKDDLDLELRLGFN